jgi:hypothetical protein
MTSQIDQIRELKRHQEINRNLRQFYPPECFQIDAVCPSCRRPVSVMVPIEVKDSKYIAHLEEKLLRCRVELDEAHQTIEKLGNIIKTIDPIRHINDPDSDARD